MNLVEVERRLCSILERDWRPIPTAQIQEMLELAKAGEPGVARENLCTQVEEYEVSVPPQVMGELRDLSAAMGIAERYVQRLRIRA